MMRRVVVCAVVSTACALAPAAARLPRGSALAATAVEARWDALESEWGLVPDKLSFDLAPVLEKPAFMRCSSFLTPAECVDVIEASRDTDEATEYLNARVNADVGGAAQAASGYGAAQAGAAVEWSGGATSGRRTRVPQNVLDDIVVPKLLRVLGLEGRRVRFSDQLFYRPDRLTVIVRDATVVKYVGGEGVAPHVDGKDATLLVYLTSLPDGAGGRTVFPEENLAFKPSQGQALLYDSKRDLLHFAEPVAEGHEKWVLQLLVDFKVAESDRNAPIVDWDTGQIIG
ncbi:hypothetical protein M885DRAFT_610701 [Pelagophyceae sp. CCMP2097]|nr:hypothetical protein M885DRAFT_610701 [Pelagophyceae sp. CCMP2097]|mmetsp:Transcript_4007/g.14015  ORF Transcript_4007/g.14015 Transcript_4007/m.14015 type:complete len:286 (+) Transcript_4007:157-1014(+)